MIESDSVTSTQFFICPGAQKAGTTTLYNLLGQHPDIKLPKKKETKYFLRDDAQIDKQQYIEEFFTGKTLQAKILGEIDPEYLFYQNVPRKIRETLGTDVKFIFLFRNPADRAYSHYCMSRQRGFETESFERAFELEESRLATQGDHAAWHLSYFSRGFYSAQLKRYLDYFPKQNMLFLVFEDFIRDPGRVLGSVFDFLGVDDITQSIQLDIKSNESRKPRSALLSRLFGQPMLIKRAFKFLIPSRRIRWSIYPIIEKLNVSSERPENMSDSMRQNLVAYYAQEVTCISKLTGIDTSAWPGFS